LAPVNAMIDPDFPIRYDLFPRRTGCGRSPDRATQPTEGLQTRGRPSVARLRRGRETRAERRETRAERGFRTDHTGESMNRIHRKPDATTSMRPATKCTRTSALILAAGHHCVPARGLAFGLAALGLLVTLGAGNRAPAATQTIENETLRVMYDDVSGSFDIAQTPTAKVFLTDGRFEGTATRASVAAANDAVFGAGKKIVVTLADRGVASLELYATLPFVLVRTERHNSGKEMLDVRKAVPAVFTLDLGNPPFAGRGTV
jgi:hypothetical protein